MHHFGDPCIHCGVPHDDVPVGPCMGDRSKAIPLAYCVDRQAYENTGSGAETILCFMSTGEIHTEWRHPATWWWNSDWFKKATVLARNEFHSKYTRKATRA